MDCKASNAKAKRMLDWKPQFASSYDGLKTVIEGMKVNKPYFS
jgi:hypothetical protein